MKGLLTQLAFAVLASALFIVDANAAQWRGIIPLKSTRLDVERLLGRPLSVKLKFYATYKLEDEEVRIDYSDKKLCTRTDECDCRVPNDTVLHVVVHPKNEIRFSSLGLDTLTFNEIVNPENPNNVAYSNSETGLMYVISKKDDLVLYVQYGPTAKDCQEAFIANSVERP